MTHQQNQDVYTSTLKERVFSVTYVLTAGVLGFLSLLYSLLRPDAKAKLRAPAKSTDWHFVKTRMLPVWLMVHVVTFFICWAWFTAKGFFVFSGIILGANIFVLLIVLLVHGFDWYPPSDDLV